MKHEIYNGQIYINWWYEHFSHHVFIKLPETIGNNWWITEALKASSWLNCQFPGCEGDTSIRNNLSTFRPYYEYDWGFTREAYSLLIFYFKDPKIAAHFKLVWS